MRWHDNTVTLRSLGSDISEEYVRRVLVNVQECERELGDAQVQVCRNADIMPPHYSISAVMDVETGETSHWESFSGRTHKALTERQLASLVWSHAFMTWREVSALRGEKRNFTKTVAKSA